MMDTFQWEDEPPAPRPSCVGGVLFVLAVAGIAAVWAFVIWVIAAEVLG